MSAPGEKSPSVVPIFGSSDDKASPTAVRWGVSSLQDTNMGAKSADSAVSPTGSEAVAAGDPTADPSQLAHLMCVPEAFPMIMQHLLAGQQASANYPFAPNDPNSPLMLNPDQLTPGLQEAMSAAGFHPGLPFAPHLLAAHLANLQEAQQIDHSDPSQMLHFPLPSSPEHHGDSYKRRSKRSLDDSYPFIPHNTGLTESEVEHRREELAAVEASIDLSVLRHQGAGEPARRRNRFRKTVLSIHRIVTEKLYRAKSASLEVYFKEQWKISRAQVYRFIDCANIINEFEDLPDVPSRERLCRSLKHLTKTKQNRRILWEAVLRQYPASELESVTSTALQNIWSDLLSQGLTEPIPGGISNGRAPVGRPNIRKHDSDDDNAPNKKPADGRRKRRTKKSDNTLDQNDLHQLDYPNISNSLEHALMTGSHFDPLDPATAAALTSMNPHFAAFAAMQQSLMHNPPDPLTAEALANAAAAAALLAASNSAADMDTLMNEIMMRSSGQNADNGSENNQSEETNALLQNFFFHAQMFQQQLMQQHVQPPPVNEQHASSEDVHYASNVDPVVSAFGSAPFQSPNK